METTLHWLLLGAVAWPFVAAAAIGFWRRAWSSTEAALWILPLVAAGVVSIVALADGGDRATWTWSSGWLSTGLLVAVSAATGALGLHLAWDVHRRRDQSLDVDAHGASSDEESELSAEALVARAEADRFSGFDAGAFVRDPLAMFLAAGAIAVLAAAAYEAMQGAHDIVLRVDALSLWFLLLGTLVAPAIIHHSLRIDTLRHGTFVPALLLVFTGAYVLAVLAEDLTTLALGWEATTLCCVLLVRHGGGHDTLVRCRRHAGLVFLLTAVPALGLLPLAHEVGTLAAVAGGLETWVAAGVVVASLGKAGLPPFHSWLPRAMVARSTVSALLHASAMVTLGVYLPFRLNLADGLVDVEVVLALAGAAGFLWGGWRTLEATRLKEFLAHSTISNLGLALTACVATDLYVAGLLIVLLHAPAKALLFLAAGELVDADIGGFGRMIERGVASGWALETGVLGAATFASLPFAITIAKAHLLAGPQPAFGLLLLTVGAVVTMLGYVRWITAWLRASSQPDGHEMLETWGLLMLVGLSLLGIPLALPLAALAADQFGATLEWVVWLPVVLLMAVTVGLIMQLRARRSEGASPIGTSSGVYLGGGAPPLPAAADRLPHLPLSLAARGQVDIALWWGVLLLPTAALAWALGGW